MARKIILSKFNFFYFKVVRVCSFVCCNGVCKSGLLVKNRIWMRHLNETQGDLMRLFFHFLQCYLRYKCPNWRDLKRLTESVFVVALKTSLALFGGVISAALAKSGPLDITSEKSFLLFFTHENGLGHMFQKQFSYSPILLFLRRHKPKMIFGQTNPMDSDRKC